MKTIRSMASLQLSSDRHYGDARVPHRTAKRIKNFIYISEMFRSIARYLGNTVTYESLPNGVARITLAREQAKNALSRELVSELNEALDTIAADGSVRSAIIQSSVAGTFCAGADLRERKAMTEDEIAAFVRLLRSTFTKIEYLRIPVIASIDGYALGGGLELAMACDMRIASPKATLGLPETALAIIPGAGGIHRIMKLVPLGKAKEMVLTAKRYKAPELAPYGLVNEISETPNETALEWANKIASNGPVGVQAAKIAMLLSHGRDSTTADEITMLAYARTLTTKDRIVAIDAFLQKTKPVFNGN
jgi:methylglutaconyl-CoA hydratase